MKKKNVASMKAEMEEKDDRYKRIMAEFENYKRKLQTRMAFLHLE